MQHPVCAPHHRKLARLALVLLAAFFCAADAPSELNGFETASAAVPAGSIRAGGPGRDAIRSVDEPVFLPASETRVVESSTPVIGVEIAGDARAYPVHLLEYHQIVNDVVGGVPVAVTFDPLAGSSIVYRATLEGETLHFGVSGLVYESNFLLYDRESESLWSQFLGRAITGPRKGQKLEPVRSRQEAFAVWAHRHPDSKVLERPFPKRIDYRYSPFKAYWVSKTIPFPVSAKDDRYHPKEVVLGVEADGRARAYLGSVLTEAGGRIVDDFAGRRIRIAYDLEVAAFSWEAPEDVRVTDAYWFAWKAFHPDTEIWTPPAPTRTETIEPGPK